MSATILEDEFAPTVSDDGETRSLQSRRLVYTGRDADAEEDILAHTQVPQFGESINIGGKWYFCNSRQWTQTTPTNGEVTCTYSTRPPQNSRSQDFKPFSFSYKKVTEGVPVFHIEYENVAIAGDESTAGGGGFEVRSKWVRTDIPIDVEYKVLQTTVARTGGFVLDGLGNGNWDSQQSTDDIKAFDRQIGHGHKFPRLDPDAVWIMQPPSMQQTALNQYQITYAWVSDPGVGGLMIDEADMITSEPRDPWKRYHVIPNGQYGTASDWPDPPRVVQIAVMPERVRRGGGLVNNPLWTPDAWIDLPGRPFAA